jgi:SAM-dependent methyltransferase
VSNDGLTAQEAEFETILTRLRDEVERGERDAGDDQDVAQFAGLRRRGEQLWAVSAERPFLHRPGAFGRLRGLALTPLKSILRKAMCWYVEPLAVDQRRFNAVSLKLLDALSRRCDEQQAELEALRPRIEFTVELDERLTRLERRERHPAARTAAPSAAPPPARAGQVVVPDYFAYESRMRGPTERIRDRQRRYLDDFREAGPVLDIGCGRGEFLGLLREAGIEASGVDPDADMVAYCRGEGLDVEQAGGIEHLEGLEEGALGGIFAAQVVEHLPATELVRLLELAASKLRPGCLLVAETINPLSPIALRNYFADLTHAQPLVPETLELLARQCGFASVEVRFANEPEQRLVEPADPTIAANVRRLNELLFAPLDYAILART